MSRAQHWCAHGSQHSHDGTEPDADAFDDGTLDAFLRAFYAAHDEEQPCTLSVAELAARFAPNAKPEHGERSVRRAHQRIARTYGARFRQVARMYGRATLTVARWIDKPGGSGRSGDLLSDPVIVDLRDLELRASNARTRARAPRKARPPENRPRRPARPHGVTNPALFGPRGPAWEGGGVLAAVAASHGKGAAWCLAGELARPRCQAHPAEAQLAARTLAARATDAPLRLFRHLFNAALDGDPLIDKRDEVARTVCAELKGILGPPDIPATERLAELEQRLAAVLVSGGDPARAAELERAIAALRFDLGWAVGRGDPVAERVRRPPMGEPAPRATPSNRTAFLAMLPAHLRAELDDSS